MFEDLSAAIDGARGLAPLAQLGSAIWKSYAAGSLSDTDAQTLAEQIHAKKATLPSRETVRFRAPGLLLRFGQSFFPPKRRQVSPDRAVSMERRRRLAFSGPMPPALACRFTTGQLAALRVVADAVRAGGSCELSLQEIAARAGVGITTARNAIREASRDGLLTIHERRRHHRPNLPNFVRIISREWLAWISKGRGSKKAQATDSRIVDLGRNRPSTLASVNRNQRLGHPSRKERPSPS